MSLFVFAITSLFIKHHFNQNRRFFGLLHVIQTIFFYKTKSVLIEVHQSQVSISPKEDKAVQDLSLDGLRHFSEHKMLNTKYLMKKLKRLNLDVMD